MTEQSARWGFPLLQAGQAQKELFHNEALARIDVIAQAVAEAAGVDTPPGDPAPGACWVIGDSPAGEWSGRARHLAGWTEGGWRFVAPVEGMTVWLADRGVPARFLGGEWTAGELRGDCLKVAGKQVVGARRPAIPGPAGGAVIDVEARTAINAILETMRAHGAIEP